MLFLIIYLHQFFIEQADLLYYSGIDDSVMPFYKQLLLNVDFTTNNSKNSTQ